MSNTILLPAPSDSFADPGSVQATEPAIGSTGWQATFAAMFTLCADQLEVCNPGRRMVPFGATKAGGLTAASGSTYSVSVPTSHPVVKGTLGVFLGVAWMVSGSDVKTFPGLDWSLDITGPFVLSFTQSSGISRTIHGALLGLFFSNTFSLGFCYPTY